MLHVLFGTQNQNCRSGIWESSLRMFPSKFCLPHRYLKFSLISTISLICSSCFCRAAKCNPFFLFFFFFLCTAQLCFDNMYPYRTCQRRCRRWIIWEFWQLGKPGLYSDQWINGIVALLLLVFVKKSVIWEFWVALISSLATCSNFEIICLSVFGVCPTLTIRHSTLMCSAVTSSEDKQ